MKDASGVVHLVACDNVALTKIKGRWFCENHAGMVERGCLDHVFTDGTTVRENMGARIESREPVKSYEVEDGGE
jgi:hypothetical protein